MKSLLSALLLLLCICPVAAQSFYEVNFVDPDDDVEYTGLMIYYDDENCQMRLVTDELLAKDEFYESNYQQSTADKESRDDVGVMCYCPDEEGFPTFVWMWERDDASDISETPYVTFNPDDSDSYFESNYFTEIALRDMDEEYIGQFYGEEEEEYQMMLRGMRRVGSNRITVVNSGNSGSNRITVNGNHNDGSVFGGISNNSTTDVRINTTPDQNSTISGGSDYDDQTPITYAPAGSSKFHLMVIANTWVSDIGTACKRDLDNIRCEFSGIARALGMEYDEQIIEAGNYDKRSAVNMIKSVQAGPDDVLMFVYTGHGFRFDDQTDFYPNIDLTSSSYDDIRKNYASMSDIYNELTSKGARLTIVLSDCCNSAIGINTPMANSNSLFSRNNSNFDLNKLQSLFLGSSGIVRATASSPGEVSWCGVNGGFFLLSFLECLRTQVSPVQSSTPSWNQLIENTIIAARKKSVSGSGTKAQNGLQQVQTKAVNFSAPKNESFESEPNTAPGQGGSTLDI